MNICKKCNPFLRHSFRVIPDAQLHEYHGIWDNVTASVMLVLGKTAWRTEPFGAYFDLDSIEPVFTNQTQLFILMLFGSGFFSRFCLKDNNFLFLFFLIYSLSVSIHSTDKYHRFYQVVNFSRCESRWKSARKGKRKFVVFVIYIFLHSTVLNHGHTSHMLL
jgi:hypothetical protein